MNQNEKSRGNRMHVSAYLTFDGNLREAMAFCQGCFGGELTMQKVADTPMAAQAPPGAKERILHATLIQESLVLMASEMACGEGVKRETTFPWR